MINWIKHFFLNCRRKLAPISDLFTAKNLGASEGYGLKKTLKHAELKTLFDDVTNNYCEKVLGVSSDRCKEIQSKAKRCGKNDVCEIGQKCENEEE